MRAMILAAGRGTRLRPLTDQLPKALVELNGRTLLEITLSRLRSFGITEVIVNAHHFADAIIDFLHINHTFGMRVEVSREQELLDTGGGLKKAAHFFLDQPDQPFLLHNVDVLSTIDLRRMVQLHRENEALATLAVQQRMTSRSLLFDDQLRLSGRVSGDNGAPELVRPSSHYNALAFCGIHVISPRIFSRMTEEGAFPIISAYLRLAGQGDKIVGFGADEYYWKDLGTPENLKQAARDLQEGIPQQ